MKYLAIEATQLNPFRVSLDPTEIIRFSWQPRGVQTAFRVRIFRLDTNAELHDSTQTTSTNFFYNLPAGTLTYIGQIKWTVTITYSDGSSATTGDGRGQFRTASNPTVSFSAPDFSSPPISVPGQEFTATLTYAQAQNSPLKSFQFVVFDSTGVNIIQDTGELFAGDFNFVPSTTIANLVRGTTYQIQGTVTSQTNQTASTTKQTFSVAEYTVPDIVPDIVAMVNDITGNITINWADLKQVLGVVTGTSSYTTGKFGMGLQLNPSAVLTYSEPINQNDFTISWYHKMRHNFDGQILELQDDDNNIEFGYENNRFYYIDSGGTRVNSDEIIIPYTWNDFSGQLLNTYSGQLLGNFDSNFMNDFMFIQLTKDKLYIELDNFDQSFSPANTLIIDWDINLNPTSTHSSLQIMGECIIDHFHVYERQFTEQEIIDADTETETTFGVFTDYLARYENSLEAGNISAGGVAITNWRLRRLDLGTNTSKIIAQSLPKSQLEFTDFFARNKERYTYSVFAVTANGEGLGQVSNEVELNFFGYIFTDGVTSFKFDRDFDGLDTSSVDSNKDYAQHDTNTQFPVIIYATDREYATSTISALPFRIGDDGETPVTDRTTLEELRAFIHNEQEKTYKNTAGELYQVNTVEFSHDYPDNLDGEVHTVRFDVIQTGEEE